MQIESAKDLDVYKLANEFAMEIFAITKRFPSEEKYALTSQIRRSSRSVCLNLREAWAKRRYAAHFLSKLTDCDGENAETDSSLDFAKHCGYLAGTTSCIDREMCRDWPNAWRDDQKVGVVSYLGLTSNHCPLPSAQSSLSTVL
jgi:four helix bundle protein